MVDPLWLLLIEVPVAVWLIVLAVRRTRRLSARIQEVRAEMERNRVPPFMLLAQLLQEQSGRHGPRHSPDPAHRRNGRKTEAHDGEGTDGTTTGSF